MSAKKPTDEKIANIPPFGLRMLPELKERVAAAAAESGRSMNAEIIERLTAALDENSADRGELLQQIDKMRAEHEKRETHLAEQELYWHNITLSMATARRTQLLQMRAALHFILAFSERLPPEVLEYCKDLKKIYDDERDEMGDYDEQIKFLSDQAKLASQLVYAKDNPEDEEDFIIDPGKSQSNRQR